MKKPPAIILLYFAALPLSAQNKISYTYDAAGNRVMRKEAVELQKASESRQEARVGRAESGFGGKYDAELKTDEAGSCIVASVSGMAAGDRCNIEMFTLQGALVMRRDGGNGDTVLDIAGMQTGVYLVKIEINGQYKSWKVTKR